MMFWGDLRYTSHSLYGIPSVDQALQSLKWSLFFIVTSLISSDGESSVQPPNITSRNGHHMILWNFEWLKNSCWNWNTSPPFCVRSRWRWLSVVSFVVYVCIYIHMNSMDFHGLDWIAQYKAIGQDRSFDAIRAASMNYDILTKPSDPNISLHADQVRYAIVCVCICVYLRHVEWNRMSPGMWVVFVNRKKWC